MIDTLKLTQRLTAAGMQREQAEALATSVAEGVSEHSTTKADLKELEATMIKWMVGLIVPVYAILIGLLLKLSH